MNSPAETVETQAWNNRELLLRIYYQVVETNGTVRQHEREIYGEDTRQLIGLKQMALENTLFRERMKTTLRIVCATAGVALTLLVALLGVVIEKVW